MKNWAIISIFSRFFAQGIGIVQSIIIIKLLSVADYGLIGLIGSIVAILGVTQNLGISSGATREIAATTTRVEAFKVFVGSLIVRYGITLPLALILFFIAPYLGNTFYKQPEIIFPLQLFSVTMIIESAQNVLGSVVQGLKKFSFLFTFQIGIAIISIMLFIPLVFKFQLYGYYYANLLLQIIWSLIMTVYVFFIFKGNIEFPTKKELIRIIRDVFSIGLYVYVAKILYTFWQKMGPAILARSVDSVELGVFTFAMFVSAKIIMVSDAITDVTLPSMTSIFEKKHNQFQKIFSNVNSKSLFFITFSSVALIFFKEDLFSIVDYIFAFIGKDPITVKYQTSFYLMTPMIIAFWAYSLINLLKSGLSIPTKKMWQVIATYSAMLIITFVSYEFILSNSDLLYRFALSLFLGGIFAWFIYLVLNKIYVGFWALSKYDFLMLVVSGVSIFILNYSTFNKYAIFVVFIITSSMVYMYQFKRISSVPLEQ